MDKKILNWMGTAQNSFLCCPITLPYNGLNCYWSHQHDGLAYCIHPITGCVSPSIENALDGFSDRAASAMGWMRRATRPPRRASVCPHPKTSANADTWCLQLEDKPPTEFTPVCSLQEMFSKCMTEHGSPLLSQTYESVGAPAVV